MSEYNLSERLNQVAPKLSKYVLFFGSILFLILSMFLLTWANSSRDIFQLVSLSSNDSYYTITIGLAIYLIIVSVVSFVSLFYNDDRIIKLFTIAIALNILVFDAALLFVTPNLLDNTYDLSHKLEKLEQNYDWTHKQVNPNAIEATQTWDHLQQTLHCCGLYAVDDWLLVRPDNVAANIYPTSCCPQNSLNTTEACDGSRIYRKYCMRDIYPIKRTFVNLILGLIWPSIVLTCLGCIAIYSKRKSGSPLENGILSRKAGLCLFAAVVVCSIIQGILYTQKS